MSRERIDTVDWSLSPSWIRRIGVSLEKRTTERVFRVPTQSSDSPISPVLRFDEIHPHRQALGTSLITSSRRSFECESKESKVSIAQVLSFPSLCQERDQDDDEDMDESRRSWIMDSAVFSRSCLEIKSLSPSQVVILLDLSSCHELIREVPSYCNCFAFGVPYSMDKLVASGIKKIAARTRICISNFDDPEASLFAISFFCGSLAHQWKAKGTLVVLASDNGSFRKSLLRFLGQCKLFTAAFTSEDIGDFGTLIHALVRE